MNKKLIAAAVASTLVAPAAFADGHEGITAYARISNMLEISDGNTDISNAGSRFGFKGAGDIGNGLTAVGRYEFATTTDKEQSNLADLRLGYVGLSGGFGTITVGNQWSAYFNHFGTLVSPTWSQGYYLYSSIAGGPFRSSNTIKYAGSFGRVSLDADVRINDAGEDNDVAEKINGNGFGIGLTINPSDSVTIGVAYDVEEENDVTTDDVTDEVTGMVTPGTTSPADDTERFGIGAKFSFGNVGVTVGYQKKTQGASEVDHTQVYISAGLGENTSLLAGYGQAETNDSNATPNTLLAGFSHRLGGGFQFWGETASFDLDEGGDAQHRTLLGMRIDF